MRECRFRHAPKHRQKRDSKRIGNRLLRHSERRDPPEAADDGQRALPLRVGSDCR